MYGRRWILFLVFCAPVAFGQGIYKWVDEKGQVHYGEQAPEGAQAAPVTVKNEPVPAAAGDSETRAENTRRLLRALEDERTQKEEREAKEAKETEQRKRDCVLARDQLRTYKEADALYTLEKNAERRILSAAEHAAAVKEAEADVKKFCK